MNRMPVVFIYDAPCDEIYCATNVSESDALEIAMSARSKRMLRNDSTVVNLIQDFTKMHWKI